VQLVDLLDRRDAAPDMIDEEEYTARLECIKDRLVHFGDIDLLPDLIVINLAHENQVDGSIKFDLGHRLNQAFDIGISRSRQARHSLHCGGKFLRHPCRIKACHFALATGNAAENARVVTSTGSDIHNVIAGLDARQRHDRRRLAISVARAVLLWPRRIGDSRRNIVPHGGKLYALDEGSSPVLMDPATLETNGPSTFDGRYTGPMTAHPKIDARTGEMFFFGYMAAGPGTPDISFTVVGRDGKVVRTEMFKAPYASMVHDFAITDQHVIFPIFPATIDLGRIMKGGPLIAWDPEQPSLIGIMPRAGTTSEIRWFRGPPAYAYHPMNSFTEGNTVTLDLCVYPRVPLFPNADGSRAPSNLADAPARLERWTFDLAANTDQFKREPLDDLATEFPRIDDRWTGLKHRHGYTGAILGEKLPGSPFDTIVHFDLAKNARETWSPGPGDFVMEPVIASKTATKAEAGGYLLTVVFRGNENRSDLVILDAQNVKAGPIATAKLPVRVPFGFHGNWNSLNGATHQHE